MPAILQQKLAKDSNMPAPVPAGQKKNENCLELFESRANHLICDIRLRE